MRNEKGVDIGREISVLLARCLFMEGLLSCFMFSLLFNIHFIICKILETQTL